MKITKPELGQKLRFSRVVKKQLADTEEILYEFVSVPVSEEFWEISGELTGVFVGQRTWSVGENKFIKSDIVGMPMEKVYIPREHRVIWLISFNPFRKIVGVFPEDCELIE